jgi:DNA-binding IscR family transcriptional regulator
MKISQAKKEKIFEQILAFLFNSSPKMIFTSHIAKELARDEEFTKKLLQELKKKNLVIEVNKNSSGVDYIKRSRWKLSEEVYNFYKSKQN